MRARKKNITVLLVGGAVNVLIGSPHTAANAAQPIKKAKGDKNILPGKRQPQQRYITFNAPPLAAPLISYW